MKKLILLILSVVLLGGCGGRAPIKRAQEVLFNVPYIQQEQVYEELTLGVKRLSIPEIKELFCKADQIKNSYNVYYVRTKNSGDDSYFVHLSGQTLPSRKDVSMFFNPHTTLHTIAHVLFMVPAGIALTMLAPDPLTSFAGFLGLNVGLHVAESQALGLSGFEEFEKHVVAGNAEHRMTSLIAVPRAQDHHILFVPQRDAKSLILTFAVSARNKVTKELVFDFSQQG